MQFSKKGGIDDKTKNVLMGVIGLIVLVYVIAGVVPDLLTAFTDLGAVPNMPLASLFTNGVMALAVIAYLIYAIFNSMSSINK